MCMRLSGEWGVVDNQDDPCSYAKLYLHLLKRALALSWKIMFHVLKTEIL